MDAMIKSISFDFRSGLLLSREILEQMTIQSHLFQIQYASYPDGIIYGFSFKEQDNMLFLTPGLLKYNGKYYVSEQNINATETLNQEDAAFSNTGTIYAALVFIPTESQQEPEGIISSCMKLTLIKQKDFNTEKAVLLAEFQYYLGKRKWKAKNRTPYEELINQLNTQGDYYSFINVQYSLPNGNVFSPEIYRMLKECLENKEDRTESDHMLLFMLSQHEIISFEVLQQWFFSHGMNVNMKNRELVIQEFLKYIKPVSQESPSTPKKNTKKYFP